MNVQIPDLERSKSKKNGFHYTLLKVEMINLSQSGIEVIKSVFVKWLFHINCNAMQCKMKDLRVFWISMFDNFNGN